MQHLPLAFSPFFYVNLPFYLVHIVADIFLSLLIYTSLSLFLSRI
jgi:hypothetical protein